MSNFKVAVVLLLLVAIAACSRSATDTQNQPTVANTANEPRRVASVDVVKARPQEVDLTGGGSADATVRLKIQDGYHINANPPSYSYLKATALEIPSAAGISVAFISYPKPIIKKFSFAEKPLAVYEGETALTVRLQAAKSAHTGAQNLSGKLQVQACDDQVCYAPGVLDVVIPVNIK